MDGSAEGQQRNDLDRATRAAMFAVDSFVLNRLANVQITEAARTRLTVAAALGYLIGTGLIVVTPEEDWPEWLPLDIPAHLKPDVDAAVAELARLTHRFLD